MRRQHRAERFLSFELRFKGPCDRTAHCRKIVFYVIERREPSPIVAAVGFTPNHDIASIAVRIKHVDQIYAFIFRFFLFVFGIDFCRRMSGLQNQFFAIDRRRQSAVFAAGFRYPVKQLAITRETIPRLTARPRRQLSVPLRRFYACGRAFL